MRGPATRHLVVALTTSLAVLAAAGCSSDDPETPSGGSGDGLPDVIPLTLIADMTGPQAFYGTQLEAGVQAGLVEVNESGVLGESTIELTVQDTGSDPANASRLVSEAVRTDIPLLLGPSLSPEALATSPIAQEAGMPYLVDTAPPGVTDAGEYIYSMTTPQSSQTQTLVDRVSETVDSVALIFASDSPTIAALGDQTSEAFDAAGVTVTETIETSLVATDFTAVATRAIQTDPEAIGILGGGPMMPSILSTLRSQGFDGEIFGNAGADGTINEAGDAANGFRYVTEWAPDLPGDVNATFLERLGEQAPDLDPHYPAVDGYTEMLFVGLVLAEAGTTDREAVLAAMQSIAAEGFDGPAGRVEFDERQLIGPAIYVEVNDGEFTEVPE